MSFLSNRPQGSRTWAALLLVLAMPLLSACREELPTARPILPDQRPATLLPRASATPRDTATPDRPPTSEVSSSDAMTGTAGVGLPTDGETPIIQFARIDPSPWEPELRAQMHPNFSMQSNGYTVYTFESGGSLDGWYQTVVTQTEALNFLKLLIEEIDVPGMARNLESPEIRFETDLEGNPAALGPVGIVYVNSSAGSSRLVIEESVLENPPEGPYQAQLTRLHQVIQALQYWRRNTGLPSTKLQRDAVRSAIGWWVERREPYTPASVLAFGTLSRNVISPDARIGTWPLPEPLSETIDAAYGSDPTEFELTGDDGVRVLRASREVGNQFWGPNYRDSSGERYLVGVRPAVPGSNQAVLDYEYTLPRRSIQEPEADTP